MRKNETQSYRRMKCFKTEKPKMLLILIKNWIKNEMNVNEGMKGNIDAEKRSLVALSTIIISILKI